MEEIIEKIKKAYLEEITTVGSRPESIVKFCKKTAIPVDEFNKCFSGFSAIDAAIWEDLARQTIEKITPEEAYQTYTVREKLLSFYFTLIERLKPHKTFVKYCYSYRNYYKVSASFLNIFRTVFNTYIDSLIELGKQNGEIENRTLLSEQYARLGWWQTTFIISHWVYDSSSNYEKTDAAIKKSVHLFFDLLRRNFIDSGIDFMKFLFRQKTTAWCKNK